MIERWNEPTKKREKFFFKGEKYFERQKTSRNISNKPLTLELYSCFIIIWYGRETTKRRKDTNSETETRKWSRWKTKEEEEGRRDATKWRCCSLAFHPKCWSINKCSTRNTSLSMCVTAHFFLFFTSHGLSHTSDEHIGYSAIEAIRKGR